jgi:hypothetical protein
VTIQACPGSPSAPTLGVVVFDPAAFKLLYPAFNTVLDAALTQNFAEATLYLNNSCCSGVSDANVRETLLNLLTAHVTALNNGVNGQTPSGIVGRVNQATQGSVSVAADYGAVSQSSAFYLQTPWGARFWAATANYRTTQYVGPPPRNYGPYSQFGPGLCPPGYAPWGGGCGGPC